MKLKIAFQEHERDKAEKLASMNIAQLKGRKIKVTRSDRHKPFYHIYIAETLDKSTEK